MSTHESATTVTEIRSRSGTPALPLRWLAHPLRTMQRGRLSLVDGAGNQIMVIAPGAGSEAVWHLHRPWKTLWRIWRRGEIGFAEGYIAGDWDTPDLQALMHYTADNEGPLVKLATRPEWQRRFDRVRHWFRRNNRHGSRGNIRFHYDLGNEFYRQWLDPTMSYSSALFSKGDEALESAQLRKYQRLLDCLQAEPGAHILEIGCGWGGFAELAGRAGYRVTGITLSQEQLDYAQDRIRRAGLQERVDLQLRDYRDLQGHYDHIVSIEMFEAVGEEWWSTYFQIVHDRLRPGGRAALQVITIDAAAFQRYRESVDFIQMYIFPGGMLPPVDQFHALASKAGLQQKRQDFFGHDYALTLRRWFEEVQGSAGVIEALGYSKAFLRMWRYYLAYCEVGFQTQRVNLLQSILERPAEPSAPPL